jgi:hypothetical protein
MSYQESETFSRKKGRFDRQIEIGTKAALQTVRVRFERSPNAIDRLPYHNTFHTKGVIRRAGSVLSAMQQGDPTAGSARDIQLAQLAAAYHDTVQDWQEERREQEGFTVVRRKRFIGRNEEASAQEALLFMQHVNERQGEELFTMSDRRVVREAILATVPSFDARRGTVVQNNVSSQSPLLVRAVALADIGSAGMDGKKMIHKEGDALFREENLDVLETAANFQKVPAAQRESLRRRILDAQTSQINFVKGRRVLLDAELEDIPGKKNVKRLFGKFDESIGYLERLRNKRTNMSIDELLQDIGYRIGN